MFCLFLQETWNLKRPFFDQVLINSIFFICFDQTLVPCTTANFFIASDAVFKRYYFMVVVNGWIRIISLANYVCLMHKNNKGNDDPFIG